MIVVGFIFIWKQADDWMMENEDAGLEEFEKRLKDLKVVFDPIERRYDDHLTRAGKLKQAKGVLDIFLCLLLTAVAFLIPSDLCSAPSCLQESWLSSAGQCRTP